jgi:hypothetical protein
MLLRHPLLAPATDEGALAAVSAAIENPNAAPPAPTGDENANASGEENSTDSEAGQGDGGAPPGDAETRPSAAGEPSGADGADGGKGGKNATGAEADSALAGAEADRGDGRNAAGRFVKKQGETDEQLAARRSQDPQDGKKPGAASDAGAGKGGKKADHVNDPIPEEIKGRTRERIEGLVATAKDLNTKLEAQTAELESGRELFSMIEATGADAPLFARHMDVLALMCSQDPAEQQKAVTLLRAAADKLGQELGETPTGKDPLEGHADLLEEVEAGEITRKHAEELAKHRNAAAALERRRTETNTRQTELSAAEQARERVKTELNNLSAELRKKDGDAVYARKHKILVPMIKRLNSTLPPDKIVAAVREAYASIELGAPATSTGNGSNRAPAGTGARQPSRPTQGAGAGGPKAPSSPSEALDYGLEEWARATGAR